jgi:hypothetical protein
MLRWLMKTSFIMFFIVDVFVCLVFKEQLFVVLVTFIIISHSFVNVNFYENFLIQFFVTIKLRTNLLYYDNIVTVSLKLKVSIKRNFLILTPAVLFYNRKFFSIPLASSYEPSTCCWEFLYYHPYSAYSTNNFSNPQDLFC